MQDSLKCALVVETSGGGSGRHVLDLAHGLGAKGHGVTVFWSPVRAQDAFARAVQNSPHVNAVAVPMHRAVGPHDWASRRALKGAIETHGPFNILHGHSSKAGALVRILPDAIPGARIYTPHAFRTMDTDLKQPQRWIYGTIERALSRRADRIIAVSRAEFDHARNLGISQARLSIVVNGVDCPRNAGRDAAREAMQLAPQDFAVGFVGRLEAQKDPIRFVRAINHATKSVPTIRGIVIGDGALRDQAERVAKQGHVRFMGWQDAPRMMPGLDLFCMTSTYEAMPYTLLEALNAQIPIVTTAVGGAEETVRDGQTGHIVPIDSAPEHIGSILASFASDRHRCADFAKNAKHLASARTIATMVSETEAVYRSALSRSSR